VDFIVYTVLYCAVYSYDAHHGTLKSRLCHAGSLMFPQLEKELHFGYGYVCMCMRVCVDRH
jgi:hypothetical protein